MQRIEFTKRVKLGRASIPFLYEEEYRYIGKCKGMMVFVAQCESYMEIEVLDPLNVVRQKPARIMVVTLTKSRDAWHVDLTQVDDKYKGFGIAPIVYAFLMRKLDIVMEAGKMQSPGGRYIWAAMSKMRGIYMKAVDSSKNFYDIEAEDGELWSDEVDVYDGRKSIRVLASYGVYA